MALDPHINPATGVWDDNYFAKNQGGGGSGGFNVDLDAPLKQAQQNYANLGTLFSSQNNQSSDFLKRYSDTIAGQEGQSALAKRIGGELGLPTLQQNAGMLRTTLTNLPTTYSKATTGFDVNANQLSRIIGTKASELQPAVDTAERALATGEQNLNTQMGYATADQTKQLLPFATEKDLMSDRFARETTGYTSVMQSELDAIIAKMNAGVTLSEGEKNRAQQLAISEMDYQRAKEATATAQANTERTSTQIVETGGRKKLINSITGQVIQDLGPSGSGSGSAVANPSQYLTLPKTTAPKSFIPSTPAVYNSQGKQLYGPGF